MSPTPEASPTAPRFAVVLSGRGSTFRALHDAMLCGDVPGTLCGVFSDKPDAFGLASARERGLPTGALSPRDFATREQFDEALGDLVAASRPDWILLAGYMRILSPAFCARFAGHMLNIHPSRLPLYPGLHTYERALAEGAVEHGSTVHFVTAELDGGPRVAMTRLPIRGDDTVETLSARVQAAERRLYPEVARWAALGRLVWRTGQPWLDGVPLDQPVEVAVP